MKRKYIFVLNVIIMICLISGCSLTGKIPKADLSKSKALVTEMGDSATLNEVREELENAGLSNTDEFYSWVKDFAHVVEKKGNLTKEWVSPLDIQSDIYACMDSWEDKYNYSDADCRITAFLLLDGILKANKTEQEYSGSYLAFDVDALETVEKYKNIKKNMDSFTTLFGEHAPQDKEKPKDIFPRIWNEYGFEIKKENISIISVVIKDPDTNEVFVGHTGVLVERNAVNEKDAYKYLFVEKMAYEQPYRATKFNDMNELLELFTARTDYFEDATMQGTFVYLNDQLIFG